ncbi:ABC transporter ATP-binding protein [Magnetovibrio blakemorei]|uniref:ABC transporter ATP-binding protein n=1 Tax=Magnetovibrio blakemorei TaxID=28181 RepID=A0A1E5Q3T3_9PROT|nr:ABC transporter ATP-binding protein [Magnetovibrio blakemorei]OEJ64163.1 hypothetical protein BEN30_16995 [Magnetovibrio blakemorei]
MFKLNNLSRRISSVFNGVKKGLRLTTIRERRKMIFLFFSSLLLAVIQTAVLISIIPMVQLMIDPTKLPTQNVFSWIEPLINLIDGRYFLLLLAGGIFTLISLKAILSWLHLGWVSGFSAHCEVRLSSHLMYRILTSNYSWLVQQNTARLREHLFGFVSFWSRQFIRSFMRLLSDLMLAGIIVAVLIWANPLSGLIVAVGVTLFATAIFVFVRPKILEIAALKRKSILMANNISIEAIFGVKEVKMAGAEDEFSALFYEQVSTYAHGDADGQKWVQLPRITLEFFAYAALIGTATLITILDAQSAEISGLVFLYGLSTLRLMPIFSTVVSSLANLMSAFPIIEDLEKLIAVTTLTETAAPKDVVLLPWERIVLEQVSLTYEGSQRSAISDVSLIIEPGKSYGVVGPSGAGKSSLIDLIVGLLAPSKGSVSVDANILKAEERRTWRRRFGYVSQKPFLLDATLRDNIIFGSHSITNQNSEEVKQRISRAIKLAHLEQVVERLPKGLSSRLGEQGILLSGGERQRVAIARALFRGADILILDEATSSLDTLIEQEVASSIRTLHGEVTTIIVSHRLKLVENCDEIWVLNNAELVERGAHSKLMETCDLYHRMVMQIT